MHSLLGDGPVEASAPCRIDMGGTLDLSTFYLPLQPLGPCTFNAALNLRTRVRLLPHTVGKIKISATGFAETEVDAAAVPFGPPLGLMMAVAAYFGAEGVHIHIDSASPPRSALGGSSVAAAALIWAFCKLLARQGRPMPGPSAVASLAHAIEQGVSGAICGMQDQLAAVYGGVNGWYWSGMLQGAAFQRRPIPAVGDAAAFSRQLLVAYCGVPHVSADINGTWVRDFLAGRHRDLWHEIVLCSRGFIDALAEGRLAKARELMNRETDLRCRMTPEVLDDIGRQLADTARRADCGARFTGAGGGGCLWALGSAAGIDALRPEWARIVDQREQACILEAAVDPEGLL
ncbi:MAG: galactokinase [Desulfatitalea sp.]|nr:galactokinase [Desulfatitalea sp.]